MVRIYTSYRFYYYSQVICIDLCKKFCRNSLRDVRRVLKPFLRLALAQTIYTNSLSNFKSCRTVKPFVQTLHKAIVGRYKAFAQTSVFPKKKTVYLTCYKLIIIFQDKKIDTQKRQIKLALKDIPTISTTNFK